MTASERTDQGEQLLTAGVRPITETDRLAVRAAAPLRPRRNPAARQKPCDHGLFDEGARAQMDIADLLTP